MNRNRKIAKVYQFRKQIERNIKERKDKENDKKNNVTGNNA